MKPQRVQMGRHGPQFTFVEDEGIVYLIDHDIGLPVVAAQEKVCSFIWEHLPHLPDEGRIVFQSGIGWDQMRVARRSYAGPSMDYPLIDLDKARQALGLDAEGQGSRDTCCAS